MKKLEDKIWQFGLLSREEQIAVELQANDHHELATVLTEVKALYQLLAESGMMDDNDPSDLALAYYVAQESFASAGAPAKMAIAYQHLAKKVQQDEGCYNRYKMIQARMEEVAGYSDPVTEFEKLTGHKIQDIPVVDKRKMIFGREDRGPIVREPVLHQNKWSSSIAVILVLGIMGVLIGNNRLERLAYMEPETVARLAPSEFRGIDELPAGEQIDEPFMNQQQALLKEGILAFLSAQNSWMNIYYTYDHQRLAEAEQVVLSLKETMSQQGSGINGWLLNEINFVLAKIYLAQDKLEEARAHLEVIQQQPGDIYNKARQLLDRL